MWGDKNFANAIGAASRRGKVTEALTAATGGRRENFFKQGTTERLIAEIGEELHTQYLLTFRPDREPQGSAFHPIRVEVAGRGDLTVRTRAGYWPNANRKG